MTQIYKNINIIHATEIPEDDTLIIIIGHTFTFNTFFNNKDHHDITLIGERKYKKFYQHNSNLFPQFNLTRVKGFYFILFYFFCRCVWDTEANNLEINTGSHIVCVYPDLLYTSQPISRWYTSQKQQEVSQQFYQIVTLVGGKNLSVFMRRLNARRNISFVLRTMRRPFLRINHRK